ncbi:MAG: hypothetical protein RIS17_409 [Pseudomonadota bacterium]|jgi:hypothetical protein
MRHNPVTLWFRPKRLGLGWTPVTWEGWAVTGLLALVLVGLAWLER